MQIGGRIQMNLELRESFKEHVKSKVQLRSLLQVLTVPSHVGNSKGNIFGCSLAPTSVDLDNGFICVEWLGVVSESSIISVLVDTTFQT